MKRIKLIHLILGMLMISGCTPAAFLPTASATGPLAEPTMPASTATSAAPIPAGWVSAEVPGEQCKYAISYPPEIEFTDQTPYSRTFAFKLTDPDQGARNFIYVSMIPSEIQDMVKQGIYQNEVYNYDPAEAAVLQTMQVGESKPVRDLPNVESGFTYERKPDAQIGGQAAQTYENAKPWEFPVGTKEIRYSLSQNGCTYLIGGYMDTAGSNQPGTITEDFFHQVVATLQLMP